MKTLESMSHSTLKNYAIAGLNSSLIGGGEYGAYGKVRLFKNERNHMDNITPHSHRFNFYCLVLSGYVTNTIWTECVDGGDEFAITEMTYGGEFGLLKRGDRKFALMRSEDFAYKEGDFYGMSAEEIHHIRFSKGASVLFFEGPEKNNTSLIIEPVVNGEIIRTYERKKWMFQSE